MLVKKGGGGCITFGLKCFILSCILQNAKLQMGRWVETKLKQGRLTARKLDAPRALPAVDQQVLLSFCAHVRSGLSGDTDSDDNLIPSSRQAAVAHISHLSHPLGAQRATQRRAAYSVFNYVHYHYCYQRRRHQQLISILLFCQTELELKRRSTRWI